jgi:hypothetical protein
MATEEDAARSALEESLRGLGETQLEIQVATALGYDTQALGLMAVAAGLGGVLLALQSTLEQFWWITSLIAAVLSILACIASLSIAHVDKTGQHLTDALNDKDHPPREIQQAVTKSIAKAVDDNRPSLERREEWTRVALGWLLASLVLAVLAKTIA